MKNIIFNLRAERIEWEMKMLKLNWGRRKIATSVLLCAILVGAVAFWQMNHNAQAALLDTMPAGLVGWWNLDEGSGTVAEDSSGNGNDGVLLPGGSEPQWIVGKYGQALSFDGVDDYVQVSDSPSLQVTGDLTIAFWINLNSLSVNIVPVDKAWNGEYFVKILSNGALTFAQGASGDAEELVVLPGGSIVSGQWIHVAVVRSTSGSELTAYKNGVATTPVTYTKIPTISSQPVVIGAEDAVHNLLDGVIDDVRIYNRVLLSAEIATLLQNEPGFSSRLVTNVPEGTTQLIATLSWQGTGSLNVTVESPSVNYTENDVPVYQKTTYSTANGPSGMLNIKRLSVSVSALPADEVWYVALDVENVDAYQISVEVQK